MCSSASFANSGPMVLRVMANDSELMVAVLVWFWWNVVVAIAIAVWYAGKMPGEGKKLLKYDDDCNDVSQDSSTRHVTLTL